MEEFIQGFIDEALQLVESLDGLLIDAENNADKSAEIQEIFRVMHTIKGSSAMFGFTNTEQITHYLEDVYDLIRENKHELSSNIITLTFKTSDIIKSLLQNNDKLLSEIEEEYNFVLSAIKELSLPFEFENSTEQNISVQSEKKDDSSEKIFYIWFKPASDVLKRGLAVPVIFDELEELGRYSGIPFINEIPSPQEFDPSEFYLAWDLFISTSAPLEDITDCFMFYMSNEYKVIELTNTSLETNDEFLQHCIALNQGDSNINEIQEKLDSLLTVNNVKKHVESNHKKEPVSLNKNEKEKTNKSSNLNTIKVDSAKLDELVNLVSDLVTLNSRLELIANKTEDEFFKKTVKAVSKLSKRFRDNALDMRLIPVKVLELKMQRLIRDVSKSLNKEVQFMVEGTKTELDKNIIARLESPLMHILRNSLDHGLESTEERIIADKPAKGVIRFIAFYSGSNVFIQIQDDGQGINPEKIKQKAIEKGLIGNEETLEKHEVFDLLFKPGFSTASSVTNISGRGVGLDVVKNEITSMRGEIDIESEVGLGTSFTIKLPLTLTIIDTLMVKVNDNRILIPREYIVQTHLEKNMDKQPDKIEFNDELIPVITLQEEFSDKAKELTKAYYIIVNQNDKNYALVVDKIFGEHQAVVKPLGYYNKSHNYFSGASILGDGSLALILDVTKLINMKRSMSGLGKYNLK